MQKLGGLDYRMFIWLRPSYGDRIREAGPYSICYIAACWPFEKGDSEQLDSACNRVTSLPREMQGMWSFKKLSKKKTEGDRKWNFPII
jgi:hypothetical protein